MAVTDLFAGEIAAELLKMLISISRESFMCKSSAEQMVTYIQQVLPIIQEIQYSGVELSELRQFQIDRFVHTLREGQELAKKVQACGRWNVYRKVQLARKMEKLEKNILRFLNGPLQAHILADVHHMRFESAERFDRLEFSARRLEEQLGGMKIGVGGGGWLAEAVKRGGEEEESCEGLTSMGVGMALGKKKVKEMLIDRDDLRVVGIHGIGGSGKTTVAKEICRDGEVRSYFDDRILFLTVSQSPNVEQLRSHISEYSEGKDMTNSHGPIRRWKSQFERRIRVRTLVVLDDIWSLSVLEQLISRIPGCKTLVVSRFKFPTVLNLTYELELLREDEAISLFCHVAFGQKSIPLSANENLVKQVVRECKGLPLALKVIGASLRDRPQMFWASAASRLSQAEPICESHETKLLERMAVGIADLPKMVRECFLDLGAFPEDKKIPLDVLINIWVEIHDLFQDDAFAVLYELAEKNLLSLVNDARAGDIYSSYFEISASQHDVLRDLALYMSKRESINDRRRLLMPRRETRLPKEWERNMDQPFNAQIVSIHTGEMGETDWFQMDLPKAEVLILNFSSSEYFLPPFINRMPKLRALILINYSTSTAILNNVEVFSKLTNLRSLWFEKISIPEFPKATIPMKSLKKIFLVLCKIANSLDQSVVDLPQMFPCLAELTMDHCDDLCELPSSISRMHSLECMSITNCHSLQELPADLGKLNSLQILRIYDCPSLKTLPPGLCELKCLKYLDISQCVGLECLPEGIGGLLRLEKIDMRKCSRIRNLPKSAASLQLLRHVICDEEISWLWKDVETAVPGVHVEFARECFDLDWLVE
ncbi:probable disease resistance protein At4g33300 [Vitis riparia]|uniref:probable disease resistance protein At4g33300 n=1 Tax=Vitis riparia TaxID=96939 RepID=UPI00155B3F39|nr:probable disease resistance protein At4g33300 [Vitis riparia]